MFASIFSRASIRRLSVSLSLLTAVTAFSAQLGSRKKSKEPDVFPASDEGELAIKQFKIPAGFKMDLFAAEPMLANPVCFAFDEHGNAYVVETFRHTHGTVDTRKHMNWLDQELASKTIDDQLAKIKKYMSELPDMTKESEKLSFIQDTDGDGKADKYTIFAEGFTNLLDGIAAGVLPRKGDVYFTCIPNLYLLRDKDGDGAADEKNILQTGYGVRFAFIGHDLHGLKIGPDGRLYFSIGDRAFNVKQGDRTIAFPEGGAVLRCELDGSNLDIVAYGLRNPQELAFDDYGNLFTADNNSDGGDQARWVYIVEGADSGWRIGWQYVTYPNNRGPWNSEGMWDPAKARDIGYIVPPLANIGNGPSGLTYYPGVGMPEKFNGHFFLADFKGSGAKSLIHTFSNRPSGASFELIDREDFVSNILVTDVDFGPDSAMYISDWVAGWDKPGKGRLYRLTPTNAENAELVAETKKLIGQDLDQKPTPDLLKLLSHRDQRVRQEAQFSLAAKGQSSISGLVAVLQNETNRLPRLHAIWALSQIARKSTPATVNPLIALLSDTDSEIRCQAAKALGDARIAAAYDGLLKMLSDVNEPRGQFFAAMALGKLRDQRAIQPILEMIRGNNDKDAYLRHAGVMALLWLGDDKAIVAATEDNSPAVRLAAAVALRRLQRADIATLLHDKQQNIVVEAARAISDLPIDQALPQLAKLIEQPNYDQALFRRVLNANYRLGTSENAAALAKLAARGEAPENLRAEAVEMLSEWEKPSGRDRVTGLWRPIQARDAKPAVDALRPVLNEILTNAPAQVRLAAVKFAEKYNVTEASGTAFELVADTNLDPDVRVEALRFLADLKDAKALEAIELAAKDSREKLRKEAVKLQAKLNPDDATLPLIDTLENGTTGEKQNALMTLGTLKSEKANSVLNEWLDKLIENKVPAELQLDLLSAAGKRSDQNLKEKLQKFEADRGKEDIAAFRECLAGGNADEGRKVFFERVEASCNRCHKVKGEGGEVGPILDGLGARKDREYILRSIVNPNAEIAPGFETVTVTSKQGTLYAGVLKSESDSEMVIISPEDGPVTVKKSDVAKRERGASGMPPELANVLSKQDLRNLVEYLASQK